MKDTSNTFCTCGKVLGECLCRRGTVSIFHDLEMLKHVLARLSSVSLAQVEAAEKSVKGLDVRSELREAEAALKKMLTAT